MGKSHVICFRPTDEQYEYLTGLSEKTGKSESELLRQLIDNCKNENNRKFESKEHFVLSKQLIYEINRIGNNINQIAKNNNSHYYTPNEKEKLFEMMEEVMRRLE